MSINILMNTIIRCYTLFNITQTGVLNRSKPPLDMNIGEWTFKRNTQCNYDTILQIVSIRSQPEVFKSPVVNDIKSYEVKYFGSKYNDSRNRKYSCWIFDFGVQHANVFTDSDDVLGALYKDCDGVPMIIVGGEHSSLTTFLSTDKELKNIHFEIL